ncbi:hypothetical protein C0J52_05303, partial [Blattella germanica]
SYVIVAPRTIHPATLYGVAISILENSRIEYPYITIPATATAGQYKLRIEGNYPHTSRGTAFLNETEIAFTPQFLSIVIQTSRPVYKSGQVVRFRVVLLNNELKPYEDAVTVYVLNSEGFVMRRWISTQINNGVISQKFTLPQLIEVGYWKIRVQALDQIQDQRIRVEKYFSPLFEVHVSLPAYTLDTEQYVAANISARSSLERLARGNATITLYGRYLNRTDSHKFIWEDRISLKNGQHYVLIPMDMVESAMGSLNNVELQLNATLTENLYGETVKGFSQTRLISGSINVYFLGPSPAVFKPGMLFEGYFEGGSNVNLPDIVALPKGEHIMLPNEIDDNDWNGHGFTVEYADMLSVERYRNEGVLYFKFDVPPKVSEINLRAYYQDSEGGSAHAKMKAIQYFSPFRKYISVRSSSHNAEAGEFAVFHVKTNFRLESFHYMILSKGFLLYSEQQIVESNGPTITTFALPISPSMAPGFRLLVYHVLLNGELLADSTFVPVDGFNGFNVKDSPNIPKKRRWEGISLVVNQGKDHTKKTAEAVMTAKAGAFMALNSIRSISYFMQAGNEMTRSRVTETPKIKWISRQGLQPDEVKYFTSMSHGKDSNETFTDAGVIVFTDAYMGNHVVENLVINHVSLKDELYDTEGNDWGWKEMNAEFGGEEYFTMNMPAFSSTRPFMMHVEGPSACRRGEQLGLRLLLLNNEPYEMFVVLTLHGSPDYKFVHVEEGGIVTSFGARLTGGDHQHLVYLPPGAQQQGEGAMVNKHTAVYLDLKNRALVLQYLDIYVEESPIVPYQQWRRYVFGSTSGDITLTGDVIGPAFPSIPLTASVVIGREVKGTDGRIFELAINIWTLHYLRLTNQLDWYLTKQVLEEVNIIFAQAMKRFDNEGWFKNWDTSRPSVWLTAWAIRIFKHATFQDWENLFYVEPQIFSKSVDWILQHQTDIGSFVETPWYENPLDWKMRGKYHNVSLTAHVLITLHEVTQVVQGSVRTDAAKASVKAIRYLERQLPSMTDPFDIAITAYALTLCDSLEKEYAFILLQKSHLEVADGFIYWSRVPVPHNTIRYENQRPFICPRDYQTDDTLAVEATSYALMVYLMREGVTYVPEKIVQWLTSVRMASSSFISTTDSAIALQALTEYAFRARLKDITDMTVTMELPSTEGFRHTLHVDNTTFSTTQKLDVPNVFGHLNVIAKGSGQAVVQMDINFGVDYEGFRELAIIETFDLEVQEYYSTFRNKSFITIQSCFRWLLDDPPVSGSTVLEVEIPTGYNLLESEAEELVASGAHPTLRDGRTIEGKTYWFFEYITRERTCFNHTVKRWYPVANISLYRQVQMYETYAKENFIMILVNSTPLYVLNICEVCGSYQCPYCPYYSRTSLLMPSKYLISIFIMVLQITRVFTNIT